MNRSKEGIMKNTFWIKGGLVLILGSFLFFGMPIQGVSQALDSNSEKNAIEYIIEDIQGPNVQILEQGETKWEPAEEGQVIDAGDEIKVGDNSESTLMLETDITVHLSAQSDLKVEQITANETGGFLSRLKVLAGLILSDVKKNLHDSHSAFEVEANGVVCGVRGTVFEVNALGDNVQTVTHEGKVEVSSGGESHLVTAGNLSAFKAGKFQMQRRLDRAEIQRFRNWRTHRAVIQQKRFARIQAIRSHLRKPWQRKHPRFFEDKHPLLKKELNKRRRRKL